MHNSLARIFIIVIAVLAYTSQVSASASMKCDTASSDLHSMAMSMSVMEENTDGHSMNMQDDCCGEECDCIESSCHSTNIIPCEFSLLFSQKTVEQVTLLSVDVQSPEHTSLYRPPIFS